MISKNSELRFDKARTRLSLALQNLENTVKEKLHEEAIQSRLIETSTNDIAHNQSIIVEQTNTIQSLNHEINALQKNLKDLSHENEFLNEKARTMAQRMRDTQEQQKKLIEVIEMDLFKIEEIINNEE